MADEVAAVRVSRPCYDKMHRCPGWAGGGLLYAKVNRCPGIGYVAVDYDAKWWRFRTHRCDRCDVLVLPHAIRWLDWRWLSLPLRLKFGRP